MRPITSSLFAVCLFGACLACAGVGGEPPADSLTTSTWSDCEAICAKVRESCGQLEHFGPGPMACLMYCDSAAQWEGQPMPDKTTEAVRESMLCLAEAETCDVVSSCLSEE